MLNTCFLLANEYRQLALYSHLLPIFVSLSIGYFVFKFSSKRTTNTFFLSFSILISIWLLGDLITWYSNNYFVVAAFWSVLDYINILFYLALLLFFITLITDKNTLPKYLTPVFLIASIFPFVITLSGASVGAFDETNCEMTTNELLANYKLVVEIISILIIAILGIITIIKRWKTRQERNKIFVLTSSIVIFLSIFSGSEYIATLTDVFEITLYALFTLPIFLSILTFNIVEQGTFKFSGDSFILAKLLFFIFIVVAIFNLVLADDAFEFAISGVSTTVTLGFGLLLLRSARREVKQREQIEGLAVGLEKANARLQVLDKQKSEFVSIASHQLRSPLTAIRGYTSMLIEGSYGVLSSKALEPLNRIDESIRYMASSIDDFLSVSRIESGNMKYEETDFNLREQAAHIVEDLQPEALRLGLVLLYKSDMTAEGIVHADIGKTQQILHNLINNSLKYTPKGSVTVLVHENLKYHKLYVEIIDTGIGMSAKTIDGLFGKFARAENANSVNIKGTGLGLFVAREMARAMHGDITAHSDGDGKGSRFILTLPLIK